MKDLFKRGSGKQVSPGTSRKEAAVADSRDVADFLGKLATLPRTSTADARLVFALDATASRQLTWDRASHLQRDMFVSAQSLGGFQLQVCYFQGLAGFYKTPWQTDPDRVLKLMTGIHCQAGMTQIQRVLRHIIEESKQGKISCVIYIGDAMEENIDILCQQAGQLGMLNIPLFIFQERDEPVARSAFEQMARLSGGAYCRFDTASADQLRDLLKAVAIYAAGGKQALEDFSRTSHQSVKLLGRQIK
ncbi:MAG: hypothetical protein RLZZ385_917 [Pseudomonadota bacterium]|jgi:hypothetical protein